MPEDMEIDPFAEANPEVQDDLFSEMVEAEGQDTRAEDELMLEGDAAPAPQSNEQVRYQHWQSEYSKARAENEKLKEYLLVLQQQMLASNQPSEGHPPNTPDAGSRASAAPSKRPEPPKPPAYYDPYDALNSPESESFKYREAYEQYDRDKIAYVEALSGNYERQLMQQQQAQAQQQQIAAWASQLKSQHGASDEDVAEFFRVMDSPESLNLNNLWSLYNVLKGRAPQAQPPRRAQQQRPLPPPSSATGGRTPHDTRGVEDKIFDAILTEEKEKDIWGSY